MACASDTASPTGRVTVPGSQAISATPTARITTSAATIATSALTTLPSDLRAASAVPSRLNFRMVFIWS